MADRITQLERLTRLRAEAALSPEEFEEEKQRLLSSQPRRIWMFAFSAFALVVILVTVLVLVLRREPLQENAKAAVESSRTGGGSVAGPSALPQRPAAAPSPPDISSRIHIADGNCRFSPDLEQAFDNMLHSDGTRVRPRQVRIGNMQITPSVTSSRDEGVNLPNYRSYESAVNLPRPVIWNGLQVTGLRAATGWEWAWQSIEFADGPARVRSVIQGMGIRIPASGSLELPAEACPGTLVVQARGRGSFLSCGGSC